MVGMMGTVESLIVVMMFLINLVINLAIPVAVLVFAILIYRKLDRIERALGHREQ